MSAKKLKKLPKWNRSHKLITGGVILVVALIGSYLLIQSHAASTYVSTEVESGKLTGTAVVKASSAASGSSYVQFGTANGGNPTGNFYIVGDKIVAPDGSIYFPEGANMATPDTLDSSYDAIGRSADAQAWGWNTVRLIFYCTKDGANVSDGTASFNDYISQNGQAAFNTMLNSLIQEYTSKKIVVDVTCFDQSYGGSNYSLVNPELNTFWTYMGNTYKNNPYVWFDPMNEGFWAQPTTEFVSWYQAMYNTIRATGAENPMIVDIENDGNDAGWNGASQIFTAASGPEIADGKCNVLFAMHNYGGLSDTVGNYTDFSVYNTYWQNVQKAGLAMFVEEFGYTVNSPSQDNVAGANATMQNGPNFGIGGLWWAGISNDGLSLKADGGIFDEGGNDVNLSTAGTAVWNYSHTTRNLGKFAGSYAASNCTSAQ